MEPRENLLSNSTYLSVLDQLKKYFESKKIKQAEIILKSGISSARISKILHKKEVLSMNEFMNMANAFNLKVIVETEEILNLLKKIIDK